MKKKITKTVLIISAVSVALGIVLCAAGASANGSFNNILGRLGIHIERGTGGGYDKYSGSYSIGDGDIDSFFDDFFGDDFDIHGGENDETSL